MAPPPCSATRLPPIHWRPLPRLCAPASRRVCPSRSSTHGCAYLSAPKACYEPTIHRFSELCNTSQSKILCRGKVRCLVLRHVLSLPSGISVPAASRRTEGTLGGDRLFAGSATHRFYGFEFLLFRENSALKSAKQRTRAKGVKRCLWRCLQRSFSTDFSTGSMRKASCPSC